MIFEGFEIHVSTDIFIHEAFCTNINCKRKSKLTQVSSGFSIALFCEACKSVYCLKLVRVPKVSRKFIKECKDEIEAKKCIK